MRGRGGGGGGGHGEGINEERITDGKDERNVSHKRLMR